MDDGQNKDKSDSLKTFSTMRTSIQSPGLSSIKRLNHLPTLPTPLILLICLILGLSGGVAGEKLAKQSSNNTIAAKQQFVSDESALIASIAKTVGPSVVSIDVQSQSTSTDIFGFSQPIAQQSAGTGFIISSSGLIVTNRHVVPTGTTSVSVTLADGTKFDNVQVVGRTAGTSSQDVAFLKITNLDGKTLTPATLGDSSKMNVGDRVIAIGNALGQFQNTVTSGIISGFGRDVTAGDQSGLTASENLTDLFQTDAAINEGNSGGPLVNINGEVIGVNTAIASNAQNIGFAQPINDLKGLISGVLANGELKVPYLGVRYVSLTNDIASELKLSVKRGAYVISNGTDPAVLDGSPAATAGIQEKDIITKVNNIAIDNKTGLTAAISRFKVGDKVTLTLVRGAKTVTLRATLAAQPTN